MVNQWSKIALCAGLAAAASGLPGASVLAQNPNPLVTGKKITLPPLGIQTPVGSLPMNMILTPDGKYAISTDMGFRESLHSINTITGKDASAPLGFSAKTTATEPTALPDFTTVWPQSPTATAAAPSTPLKAPATRLRW